MYHKHRKTQPVVLYNHLKTYKYLDFPFFNHRKYKNLNFVAIIVVVQGQISG